MAIFDFERFWGDQKEKFKTELAHSKNIQDEVKVYNERFPQHLEPLHSLVDDVETALEASMSVGEFNDSGMIAGDSYEEQAWSYFLGKDFNKKCIAGIMGNLEQESGVDPTSIQNGGGGPGTGLVQWGDNMDGGRWNALEKWAQKEGRDKWDMLTQLDYLWLEMNQQYHLNLFSRNLRKQGYNPGNDPLKAFSQVDNVKHGVIIFEETIERAGDPMYPERFKYANTFYEKYKDWDPSMATTSGGPSGARYFPVNPTRSGINFWSNSSSSLQKNMDYGRRTSGDWHSGYDIGGGGNRHPVYATTDGVVTRANTGSGIGYVVTIKHTSDSYHSLYGHMTSNLLVKEGDRVQAGQQIGTMSNTGGNYSIHLHYELSKDGTFFDSGNTLDPKSYLGVTGDNKTSLSHPG